MSVPVVVLERLPENLACSQCGRRFVCQTQLSQHEAVHSAEGETKGSSPQSPKKGRFRCKICGKFFCSTKTLKRHNNCKHPRIPPGDCSLNQFDVSKSKFKASQVFSCVQCGQHFATHQNLKKHESRSHQRVPQLYRCVHCGMNFALPDTLKLHAKVFHGYSSR